MPRQTLSPAAAQANARAQATDAADAAQTIVSILSGTDSFPADRRESILLDAAKVLEAAGCYVRRQNAKGLLVP